MFGRRRDPWEWVFDWAVESGGCVVLVVGLTVALLFLSTMAGTVGRVRRENRRIEPAQVWLNLLPFFNLVWLPITVDRVAASIRAECEERGLDDPGEGFTRPVGLTWLSLAAFLLPGAWMSDSFGTACFVLAVFLMALGFWVGYWAQLASYARRLRATKYAPPADEGW